MKNQKLLTSKADKGDTTVVMSTKQYLTMAFKHFNDPDTYQLLESDPTLEIAERFIAYLDLCHERREITPAQHNRLHLPVEVETQTMYTLAKIHKHPVKLRPIVSCTKGPTCTCSASEFLDRILQPHMRKVKSYPGNSMDLVRILRTLKVRPNAYLITLGIESLYTNISHEKAITSVLRIHRKHSQKYSCWTS